MSSPMPYDTVVVGLGPSGVAAATTLAKAGKRVLALEADNRIGGRVKTVPFGDGIVELGAEWIHGTEQSSLYDLAIKNNISVQPQDLMFKVHRSDGSVVDEVIINDLLEFCLSVVDDPPESPQPLGEYISTRVQTYIAEKYPTLANDKDFITEFLHFMDLVIDNYESSNSWNEVSTSTNYKELEGHQHMSWHKYGYKTLFDILLNTHNNGTGIPNLDIKLNSEVTKITWQPESSANVEVKVADGNTFTASNVIVTVSLGVLKERHASIFNPPLPQEKVDIMNSLSIGIVNKIVLLFNEAWWPADATFYGFIWKGIDRKNVGLENKWVTEVFGVSCPLGNRKAMTVWTSGEGARVIENLDNEVLKTKSMELIRRFLGKNYTIPDPVDIIKSNWYSNPFTRGSYSFDNLLTPNNLNARVTLGQPLTDSLGVNRILFAGEASDQYHFSTVHGALDTGFREANRLLGVKSKI